MAENEIIWLSKRYLNYHSECFNSLVSDYMFTEHNRYALNKANTDYNTTAKYYCSAGRIHTSETFTGYDQIGLVGFYDRYITTTQMLEALQSVGNSGYLYRFVNQDGSGGYCRLTLTDIVYTGTNLDILNWLKIELDRGWFTDVSDETTYESYGTDSLTMGSNEIYHADARLYLAQGFTILADTELPIFYYSAQCVWPTGLRDNPSTVPYMPECPINLPERFYNEYYPENGTYGSAQDGTSQGDAFADVTNCNVHGNGISIFNTSKLCRDLSTSITAIEYSPEAGPESEEDGMKDPSFDDSSDTIALPDVPEIGVTNVGFVNVYKTEQNSLQNMGVELFPPLQYTVPPAISANDVKDAIVNGVNNVMTWLANIPSFFEQINAATYINYIIDCHVIPVTPPGGTSENIKVGNKTLQTSGKRLSNDYVDVPCGSISLAEYYTNFADFLTTFKLYLPFVGFVPARPEWFYRERLDVTYRFNIINGSFMAFVRSTGRYVNNNNAGPTIVGQYGGNACVHLPITGANYAAMAAGLVGAGAGAIAGAGSGNIPAMATSAIAAAAAHGDIAQSNAYDSSVSFLGCRRPFVLIERPVSDYSRTYQKENGLPSNVSKNLGSVSGFNMVGDVHLDGIDATDAEKAEIERLLREGVIL